MNIKIDKQNEQALQSRTEIIADMTFSGPTPSRNQIRAELAKKLDSKENLIVIQNVKAQFGFGKSAVIAHAYKDEKSLKQFEPEHLTKRGMKKAEEEKPTEAPKKEAKPEDKKDGKEEKKA